MRSVRWCMKHLQKYFDKHYGEYSESAGWLVNPANNQWKFIILELGVVVTLTCDDFGYVTEEKEPIKQRDGIYYEKC